DGFRNNSTKGFADVVAIGDSYIAFALNEADTFGKRLEKLSGLTVVNLGVGGYGPFQYLEVLKRYGIKRKPKYALFGFYEGNDISDIRQYLHWKAGKDSYYSAKVLAGNFLQRYILVVSGAFKYAGNTMSLPEKLSFERINKNRQHTHPDIVNLNVKGVS